MTPVEFHGGRVRLLPGDCLESIKTLPDCSVDAVVTDPPYALVSIQKRFGKAGSAPAKGDVYARASAGFMGANWDVGTTAFAVEFWAEVLRVLKPGGHLLAFGGTRTVHRLITAIEDAGFEIRDMVAWLYGTGFNKRGYILRDEAGEPIGPWGGALKPALEPITLARKPLIGTQIENITAHGTGGLNINACRVGWVSAEDEREAKQKNQHGDFGSGQRGNRIYGADTSDRTNYTATGRWPANVVHDGSEEVEAAFAAFGDKGGGYGKRGAGGQNGVYSPIAGTMQVVGYGDAGTAARFFYSAKADADDRVGAGHPTIKPRPVMRWCAKLITPPGGVILDPFAGTGTTAEAALLEGFSAILCEREPEYCADISRRMDLVFSGPAIRRAESAKARKKAPKPAPLFGES